MKPRHSDRPISRQNLTSALSKRQSEIDLTISACQSSLDINPEKYDVYFGVIVRLKTAREAVKAAREWLEENKKPHKYETE